VHIDLDEKKATLQQKLKKTQLCQRVVIKHFGQTLKFKKRRSSKKMNMKKNLLLTLFTLCCLGAFAQPYTITGNVHNDPNAGTINTSASPFSLPPEGLNVVLVSSTADTIARTATVNADGTFTIASVPAGSYYATLLTPNSNMLVGAPAPAIVLETGWTRTGESLTGGASDGIIDGKTSVFTVTGNISNVKFGIQERAFAHPKMNNLMSKTATTPVALSVNMSSNFTKHGPVSNNLRLTGYDKGSGSIVNFTINSLPKYGTLYLGSPVAVPVTSLADVDSLSPSQIATLAYQPNSSALSQEQDFFTYYVTDNALTRSNNAAYVIPFSLLDSDNDGIANRDDVDSDNDGIADNAECALNDIGNLIATYPSQFSDIRPSDFGLTTVTKRTGLNMTVDMSPKFGYPANSGAVIVSITNANTHPNSNVFYTNDSTGATQWSVTGSIGCFTVLTHGIQFFSYDTRKITVLNGTPQKMLFGQEQYATVPATTSNWTSGNDGYSWWLTNPNALSTPPDTGRLVMGLISPEPKYFQFESTANNRDEWATYYVELLPECDYDMDGIPNRLDRDSDNDGCLDAVEGGGTFNYGAVDTAGRLTGAVAGNGMPTVVGAGQSMGSSQNATVLDPACFVDVTGSVFNDVNGNTNINAGETFTSLPAPLYVYLVDAAGMIVDSAKVAANGSYTLNARPNGNYNIELSTTQYAVGTNTTTTPINNTLPTGWQTTGENGTNNTGTGDGSPNGVLAVVVGTSNINNQNFGIQQPPIATDNQSLNNLYGSTVIVNVLANDNDAAPGNLVPATVSMIKPTNATNIVVDPQGDTVAMTIPGEGIWTVDATTGNITFVPENGFVGNPTPIQYVVDDNAGAQSNAALVTITYLDPIQITGSVFNDANGNTNINAGETFASLPTPLYVYLVDAAGIIVDSAKVAANGSYTLAARPNGNYTIELSTTQYAVGTNTATTPIDNTPLTGWENTGENGTNNTGTGDGNPNGVLAVVVGTSNINNQNFGIQQPPTADAKTYTVATTDFSGVPPTGYPVETGYATIPMSSTALTGVTGGSLSGTDPEDCAGASSCTTGTGTTFSIHTINANTKLYYDFGTGPVEIDVTSGPISIPNFDVTKMVVYGEIGAGQGADALGFTYSITDKAGTQSVPVNYTIQTTSPLPIVWLGFTATKNNTTSVLQWQTATEQNNNGFEIERSADSRSWSAIGFVATLAVKGNSNAKLSYAHTDKAPLSGINYYRLKQVDIDGRYVYSEVRNVTFGNNSKINIVPNPTNGLVSIFGLTKGRNQIQLVNAIGQVLINTDVENGTEYSVDLSRYTPGAYYISIRNEDGNISKHKVIKQ